MRKGLVVKIHDDYAIVVTSSNQYLRIVIKGEMKIGSKIIFTEKDLYRRNLKGGLFMKAKYLFIPIFSIALVLALVSNGVFNSSNEKIASVMTVDINPSVKLELNEEGIVVNVVKLNEDAKMLEFDLVGLSASKAVELIIQDAEAKGFIDTMDLEDDFILVTTVDLNLEDDVNNEALKLELIELSETSEVLLKVNLALTEASTNDLAVAEENGVPTGLVNENASSVGEYFKESSNLKKFSNNGIVIENSFSHQFETMLNQINELDVSDEIKEALRNTFNDSKSDFIQLKESYEKALKEYQNALVSGDEKKISEAKMALEQEQVNREAMEMYKNQVEGVKALLIQNEEKTMEQEKLQGEIDKLQQKREEDKGKNDDAGQGGQDGEAGQGGQDGEAGQGGQDGEAGQGGQDGEAGQGGQDGEAGQGGQDGEAGQGGQDGEIGQNGQDGEAGQGGQDGEAGQGGQDGETGQNGQDGNAGQGGSANN